VIWVDNSNNNRFEGEDWEERGKAFYQDRNIDRQDGERKRRWWIPITVLLIIIAVLGVLYYFASRSQHWFFQDLMAVITPEVEQAQIIIPAALFAGKDLEDIATHAVEEQGVDEVVPIEGDRLVYNMTPEVKEKLLEGARNDVKEKLSRLEEDRQYHYIVYVSYDNSFVDFFLVTDDDHFDEALITASELFVSAVYYQYLYAAGDDAREVSMIIENNETGTQEKLDYPGDIDRVASLLDSPEAVNEEPAGPAPGDKVAVDTGPDNLNLRDGPAITYLIIDILHSGTELEVIGEEGEWLQVVTPDQKEGWVHGDFVEIVDEDG